MLDILKSTAQIANFCRFLTFSDNVYVLRFVTSRFVISAVLFRDVHAVGIGLTHQASCSFFRMYSWSTPDSSAVCGRIFPSITIWMR